MSPSVGRVWGKLPLASSSLQHRALRGVAPFPVPVRGPASPSRHFRRVLNDRSGNAAAEFAILLPVFLSMMAAVIQYGSMYVTYNTMLASARDAAREVAVGRQTNGNASNRAKGKRPRWVSEGDYAVTTQDVGTTDVATTVTVPGVAATVLPILPSPENLSVTVTMAKES